MKRLAIALAFGAALAPGAHALEYTALRPEASAITFAYQQMGVGLEGRFTRFDGQISFDPAQPEAASARIEVELASIDTVAAARFAVDSHWASAWLMPKAPMMSGIATLMIVPASIAATLPVTVVSRANQRYSMPQARNPAARPSLGGSRAM